MQGVEGDACMPVTALSPCCMPLQVASCVFCFLLHAFVVPRFALWSISIHATFRFKLCPSGPAGSPQDPQPFSPWLFLVAVAAGSQYPPVCLFWLVLSMQLGLRVLLWRCNM